MLRITHAKAHEASSLRARLAKLQTEVASVKKLVAISESVVDVAKPVIDRVEDLLRANSDMAFSPAEIVDCVHASEDTVRKSLFRLCARGTVEHLHRAQYAIVGWDRERQAR